MASDLEAAVEVTNLTNKYYFNSIQDFRNNYGSKIGDVGRPREWGGDGEGSASSRREPALAGVDLDDLGRQVRLLERRH